jgi:hypothetical protein
MVDLSIGMLVYQRVADGFNMPQRQPSHFGETIPLSSRKLNHHGPLKVAPKKGERPVDATEGEHFTGFRISQLVGGWYTYLPL